MPSPEGLIPSDAQVASQETGCHSHGHPLLLFDVQVTQ